MSIASKTIDVFLSHGAHDTGIAGVVKRGLADAGLDVFSVHEVKPGKSFLADMRNALAECIGVIIVLTRSTLESSSIAFEIGAAMAWNKPVYVVYDGITTKEIPQYLREFRVCHISKILQIVEEISQSQQLFSDEDRESLMSVYQDFGVPTDQLLRKPLALHDLSKEFNQRTGANFAGEKLVQELIRLRKQGKLPKIKKQ